MPEPPAENPAAVVKKAGKGIKSLPPWLLITGGVLGLLVAIYIFRMRQSSDQSSADPTDPTDPSADPNAVDPAASGYDPAGITVPQDAYGLPGQIPTSYSGDVFGVGSGGAYPNPVGPAGPAGPAGVAGAPGPAATVVAVPTTGGGPPNRHPVHRPHKKSSKPTHPGGKQPGYWHGTGHGHWKWVYTGHHHRKHRKRR